MQPEMPWYQVNRRRSTPAPAKIYQVEIARLA